MASRILNEQFKLPGMEENRKRKVPPVLDPACGGRMFYFDKSDSRVLFGDNRMVSEMLCDGRCLNITPDCLMDFRALPFADGTFALVVFDPPHLKYGGEKSWLVKKYSKLSPKTWRTDLAGGFEECWRVLKREGTLVFKWNEYDIPIRDVLACFSQKPILGHTTKQRTHWMLFFKS